jgi:hypothetical protein
MKQTLVMLCLAGLAPGLSAGFDEAAEVDRAKEATMEYAGALKSELQSAMQAGGALQAIEVCSTEAPVIRADVSLAKNVNLSRVSSRNRNPANAPNPWQQAVLDGFEARKQEGEDVGSLSWHEIAQTDNGPEFRFMQAIPTGALCLQCHGTDIAPAVAEKLAELYPADKATGFSLGDLRGAFVVTHTLTPD